LPLDEAILAGVTVRMQYYTVPTQAQHLREAWANPVCAATPGRSRPARLSV